MNKYFKDELLWAYNSLDNVVCDYISSLNPTEDAEYIKLVNLIRNISKDAIFEVLTMKDNNEG